MTTNRKTSAAGAGGAAATASADTTTQLARFLPEPAVAVARFGDT